MTLNKKAQEYYRLKDKHAKEIAEFTDKYCGFAFNDNQRQTLLKKFKFNSCQSWKKAVLHLQDAE